MAQSQLKHHDQRVAAKSLLTLVLSERSGFISLRQHEVNLFCILILACMSKIGANDHGKHKNTTKIVSVRVTAR
jgi:hypothetical protein